MRGKGRERGGDFKIYLWPSWEEERGNKFPLEEMLLPLPLLGVLCSFHFRFGEYCGSGQLGYEVKFANKFH